MHMKPFCVFVAGCTLLLCSLANAEPFQNPAIQTLPLKDSATGHDYELFIRLPDSYDATNDKTHPVIYIADALWHLEVLSGAVGYLIDDAILVGVSWQQGIPVQQSRMRDYMPNEYAGTDYKHPTGKADHHLAFIRNDVFRTVEEKYNADPNQRTYFGYSVSGTFGSYILLTQPETFQNYIIGSPATLFQGHFIHEYEPFWGSFPSTLKANVFVSVGSDEEAEYIQHATSLVQFLKSKAQHSAQIEFTVLASQDHSSAFPLSAVQSLYWLKDILNH
ncbi:alpha/beta hydrolase [Aestuariibacter halophilus]|uniref:Alpha/beta hydrolase n=1 Tax=Fluctibacter halophilus TaxID=226011 RepID=A0ABS8G995_9ALTE|nr:alpha/beta hydrolase-fold protein [Aestuariibacter halophilus]MCC2617132.1 alpha/beta hydrolase [Aestuariibacter halophilus]